MRALRYLIGLAALVFIVGGLYYYMHYTEQFPSTDDAYVQAHIINVPAQLNGIVSTVHVQNYSHVKKNDLLFTLQSENSALAVKKAQAALEDTKQSIKGAQIDIENAQTLVTTRQAELADAQKNTARIQALVKRKLYPQSQGDDAVKQLKVAQAAYQSALKQRDEARVKLGNLGENNAKIKQAQAALDQARLNLKHSRVTAPASGYIANFSLRPGDDVNAFEPLFSIVENHHWWVDANFKETQLTQIKPGQPVRIHIDMYPTHTFTGTVLDLGRGSGSSFSVLPSENATGNWVKVTQRFPVKISLKVPKNGPTLRVGASATVTVDTRTSS